MDTVKIIPARTDGDLQAVAAAANEIWHQHFTPIIGKEQVEYMVEKFQSYPALKAQVADGGYEYFTFSDGGAVCGYIGVHAEEDALFLSKLYIREDFRGRHLATQGLLFLIELCRERGLKKIWLTCNKHNDNTLKIYSHLGFRVTDEQVADIGNGFVMDDYILTYEI